MKCAGCELEKDESEFYVDNNRKRGFTYYCKKCIYKFQVNYRKDNLDKIKIWKTNSRIKNSEKILEHYRSFREANRERLREQYKQYYKNNLEKFRVRGHNRYAIKKSGDVTILTTLFLEDLLYQQNNKCFYCKNELNKYHIEHLIPLARGGEHKEYNIVLSCPTCNLAKRDKMPDMFLQYKIGQDNARSRASSDRKSA